MMEAVAFKIDFVSTIMLVVGIKYVKVHPEWDSVLRVIMYSLPCMRNCPSGWTVISPIAFSLREAASSPA
ncbi:hypothetical protein D3C84_1059570 [compost metagenome]